MCNNGDNRATERGWIVDELGTKKQEKERRRGEKYDGELLGGKGTNTC